MLPLESKGGGEGGPCKTRSGGRLTGAEAEFGGWREGLENQTADSTEGV